MDAFLENLPPFLPISPHTDKSVGPVNTRACDVANVCRPDPRPDVVRPVRRRDGTVGRSGGQAASGGVTDRQGYVCFPLSGPAPPTADRNDRRKAPVSDYLPPASSTDEIARSPYASAPLPPWHVHRCAPP